ncbi:2-nitropropane dioxygenase [Acidipropionibacterium acidipropionici]|uniref:2-nitropropane dioxygenase n=1 Tax=Acidipropionibacterium acidipropionici TaxID=1748 RepID=A0AAC8YIL4_9ACTN|nr:2-nitropropane dioxygenase [Acidipropionibacterium acidipropionici]
MPVDDRVRLTHGILQRTADDAGVDVLHIKGPALHPDLLQHQRRDDVSLPIPRHSTDADILVRPSHLERFQEALRHEGWRMTADFIAGSAFGHAANYWHEILGYCDVHRRFPGMEIDPEVSFDLLWAGREPLEIAHIACSTPSLQAQRLMILLHAARSGRTDHPDKVRAWDEGSEADRDAVRRLAGELRAEVALAAATGHLEDYRGDRHYDLWRQFSTGDTSRWHEWRARVRAAGSPAETARVVLRALRLNQAHLRMDLGHDLTRADVLRGYRDRVLRAARELLGRRSR